MFLKISKYSLKNIFAGEVNNKSTRVRLLSHLVALGIEFTHCFGIFIINFEKCRLSSYRILLYFRKVFSKGLILYPPENTRKPLVFRYFSGGINWRHWPDMGLFAVLQRHSNIRGLTEVMKFEFRNSQFTLRIRIVMEVREYKSFNGIYEEHDLMHLLKNVLNSFKKIGSWHYAMNLLFSEVRISVNIPSKNDSKSAIKPCHFVVPQGSVLDPLLFNLYINNLQNIDPTDPVNTCQYADNTTQYEHFKISQI